MRNTWVSYQHIQSTHLKKQKQTAELKLPTCSAFLTCQDSAHYPLPCHLAPTARCWDGIPVTNTTSILSMGGWGVIKRQRQQSVPGLAFRTQPVCLPPPTPHSNNVKASHGDQPWPCSCLFVLILAFSSALSLSAFDPLIDNQLVIPSLLTSLGTLSSSQLAMFVSSQHHPTPPTRLQCLKSPPSNTSFPSLLSHKRLGWEENKTKDRALGNTNIHQNLYGRKRKKKQSTSLILAL